jgi:hypothetical protein
MTSPDTNAGFIATFHGFVMLFGPGVLAVATGELWWLLLGVVSAPMGCAAMAAPAIASTARGEA